MGVTSAHVPASVRAKAKGAAVGALLLLGALTTALGVACVEPPQPAHVEPPPFATSAAPHPPATAPVTAKPVKAPAPCAQAAAERARVTGLVTAGRIDRALRVIRRANELCPASAAESWQPELELLAELGQPDEVSKLAASIEAAADAPADLEGAARAARERAASSDHGAVDARALAAAGLEAQGAGRAAEAQRLFDRALGALEAQTGAQPTAELPNGLRDACLSLGWSHGGLTVGHGEVVSLLDAASLRERLRLGDRRETYGPAVLSPDGRWLATDATDFSVRLVEVATGRVRHALAGHTSHVRAAVFSPDGKTLASGSADKSIRLWDVATGRELRTLTGHPAVVVLLAFAPDAKSLVSASEDGTVKIWSVASGRGRRTYARRIWAVGKSRDGMMAASVVGDDDEQPGMAVQLWDPLSGRELQRISVPEETARVMAFSPDGRQLAAGTRNDGRLFLWDLANAHSLRLLVGHPSSVEAIAYAPDGKSLAACFTNRGLGIWDVASGREVRELAPQVPRIRDVALSPDGTALLSASDDGTARLWDLTEGRGFRALGGHLAAVHSVAFSWDGKLLASGDLNGTIVVRDAATTAPVRVLRTERGGAMQALAFSPDASLLASSLGLWELGTGRRRAKLSSSWEGVAFSPDGRTMALGGGNGLVELWEADPGRQLRVFNEHKLQVKSVAFSPDGKLVASGSLDSFARVWEVDTGRSVAAMDSKTRWVTDVVFSPDGTTLIGGTHDAYLKLWELPAGRELRTIETQRFETESVSASRDGKLLATATGEYGHDPHVVLWDMTSGTRRAVLRPITGLEAGYAVTPDGYVDFLGADADRLRERTLCRVGPVSLPFAVCRERLEVTGLLAKVRARDTSYREP